MNCPSCQGEVFEIDVKCKHCGVALGATGAHRMLGQAVLGCYELVDVLGQGGMSVVFLGRHQMTAQEVALKILPPELAAHREVKSRFLEEAKALAALDHPNIVHLYNFGQENGSFVLAMQYVQGKTWERVILEHGKLEWQATCRIAIDVLKALEYAHGRGVVHRDMKPSNVLVRDLDGAATVMDFGIAKMTTSTKLTATGQTMGTVRYMSPEQVRGQDVDLRTDLYSLGATIYESLTGETPFDGGTHFEIMTMHLSNIAQPPSSHGIELPQSIEDAIMRSLKKKAADRFENAREMRKVLEQALKDGDAGVIETQRLRRELLGDAKAATPDGGGKAEAKSDAKAPAKADAKPESRRSKGGSIGLAQTTQAATAKNLADELEPAGVTAAIGATSSTAPSKKSRTWIFATLAVAVLGAGGAVAALTLGKEDAPAGYQSKTRIPGVTITNGKTFDGQLLVETDGTVQPDEVAAHYKTAFDELAQFESGVEAQRDVLQEIVVVPREALCEEGFMRASAIPCSHKDTFTTAFRVKKRQLLVSNDRTALAVNVRAGVAQAVCDFQFLWLTGTDEDNAKRSDAICKMTKRFISAK